MVVKVETLMDTATLHLTTVNYQIIRPEEGFYFKSIVTDEIFNFYQRDLKLI